MTSRPSARRARIYPPPQSHAATAAPAPPSSLLALLASPNIASRRPLFEQYDSIVQSRTVRRPEQADAAVLVLPGGGALAVSIDCNGRRVAADPYRGAMEAVLECAANLACVGAEPLGTTNNLNFGNPEKPHIAWQLTEAVRGVGEACRALQAPIVGGNVSLYNEGADRADLPDAGDRHGRPHARRPRAPAGSPSGARGTDRARRAVRALARRRASSQSSTGRRCPTACPSSTSQAIRARPGSRPGRGARRRALERPRHRRGRHRGRARGVLPRGGARRRRRSRLRAGPERAVRRGPRRVRRQRPGGRAGGARRGDGRSG